MQRNVSAIAILSKLEDIIYKWYAKIIESNSHLNEGFANKMSDCNKSHGLILFVIWSNHSVLVAAVITAFPCHLFPVNCVLKFTVG